MAKMVNVEELQKEMAKCLDEIDNVSKIMDETEGVEGKEQEFDDARTIYDEKTAEFEKLEGKVKQAKDQKRRIDMLKQVEGMGAPEKDDTQSKSQTPNPPAEVADFEKKDREHTKAFFDYVRGETVTGKRADLLRPSNKNFSKGGIRLPQRLAKAIHGFDDMGLLSDILTDVEGKYQGKAMLSSQTSPASLVPQDYRAQLLQLAPEESHIYPRARKVPAPTGQVTWPKLTQTDSNEFGGVAVKWINEGGEKPETEPTFEQLQISAHEIAARTEISHTLLSRSVIDLEALLGIEFRNALMNAVDIAFLTGNGTGKPLGIFQDSIRSVARQTANQISYDDLVNMEHTLRSNHRSNAIWVIADDAMQYLKKVKDSDGRPLFVPNPSTGAYDTLLGYPYVTTHRLSLGENDIVFGDWSQYIVPVENEIVMRRSDDRKIEYNVAVFVVFMLIGGRAAHTRAFVKLGDTDAS